MATPDNKPRYGFPLEKKTAKLQKLFQERKSVKIGGVTKAPAEESGGTSLQFLQVYSPPTHFLQLFSFSRMVRR